MKSTEKVAPVGRKADGDCPGITCLTCYLRPKQGRCPFLKQE